MSWQAIPGERERELDVVGLGEISLDRAIELDRMPVVGGKQTARREWDAAGGQIATAVLGCARLGLRTAFVGAVGDDAAAEQALAPLRAGGVDLSGLQRVAGGRTRRALVLVERRDGERSVIERRDERVAIDTGACDRRLGSRARALLVDGADPEASLWAARGAREAGTAVFLDADGPASALEKLLTCVDFPVVSQRFAEEIGRSSSVRAGLERLSAAGARVAVATLGERGAIALAAGGRLLRSAAFEVVARDTTGAGDAFHAAWIAAALAGEDLEQALRMANAAAALNCVAQGAQGGLASRAELAGFLQTHRQRVWRSPY
jgi:sugar/nucleoside kinase (ribokinase family)